MKSFFCVTEDTVKKVKTQPTGWEKIFTDLTSHKTLMSRINTYKHLQLSDTKTTQFKNGSNVFG